MARNVKEDKTSGLDVLGTFWDVAIIGAGYAGMAAALAAKAAGRKAILIDPGCGLLWESALARNPEAGKMPKEMQPFMHRLECATGIAKDWIDPGAAEWVANGLLGSLDVARLYFATPVAVEFMKPGVIQTVTFALLDRLAAISAAQWIDATEDALLAGLCGLSPMPQPPIKRMYRFFAQRQRWPMRFPFDLFTGIYGAYSQMEESCWSSEKIVRLEVGNAYKGNPIDLFEPFLKVMRKRLDPKCPDALLSHWSWTPYPLYAKLPSPVPSPCQNLALAIPALGVTALETLGDRASMGVAAYARVANGNKAAKKPASKPRPAAPVPTRDIAADVCVVGAGTSGTVAAAASSRAGAKTVIIEASAAPGGLSTLGGVSSYHLGCSGGIQDELDAETKKFMQSIALPAQPVGSFHGLARLVASASMLAKAKVETCFSSRIIPGSAAMEDGRIVSVLAATPNGIAKISAKNWIDATGNADLAAAAGIKVESAAKNGLPSNPATQNWGSFCFADGAKLVLNPGASATFAVDPSDSVSMTRARIDAIDGIVKQASLAVSNSFSRTTGIAPAMGIRQGRTAKTRYAITLDDLVERRKFGDTIGFTAGTMGIVAPETIGGSRDLAFYVWCCGLGHAETACEIPYRAILAEGASNLWMAGNGAGCTPETAFQFRMMHDIQRIGEAAGAAAALASKLGVPAADVPKQRLDAALMLSGATTPWRPKKGIFGEQTPTVALKGDPVFCGPATAANVKKWIAAIGGENGGIALWRLYRLGAAKLPKEISKLLSAKGAKGNCAALLMGALGLKAAAERLKKMAAAPEEAGGGCSMKRAAEWALGLK